MMNIRLYLPILEKYINRARRFLTVTNALVNVRLVGEHDGIEQKDIVLGLLKTKEWSTGNDFTTHLLALSCLVKRYLEVSLWMGISLDSFPEGTEFEPRSMFFITKGIIILTRSPSSLPAGA